MDYLDAAFTGEKYLALYSPDPIEKAGQEMLMHVADQVASQLYVVIMTAGQLESAKVALTKALEKLNLQLA